MQVCGKYKNLLDYFNEHSGYTITEDNVTQQKREYDKSLHTAYTWIDAEDSAYQYYCEHKKSEQWGDEGEWIIMRIKKDGDYILNQKTEVKNFFDCPATDDIEELKRILNIK